ncbi:MAG: hypothetical protein LAO23_23290 [Acidobacteriia bacterium]|nr:hypothetical protein [Terriglobia bacterium]
MNLRRALILGWMMAGLQVMAVGQNSAPQNPPDQSSSDSGVRGRTPPAGAVTGIVGMGSEGAEETSEDLPQIPVLLGGFGPSTAFVTEMARSNYVRGGINVGAIYDDNPLLLSPAVSNTSETIFPNIKIDVSSSRARWSLGYAGGLTVNQKITNQNQGTHNLNFDSQFRLSPHVSLRVAEVFSMTTGFFDAGNGGEIVGGSGGPNPSLLTPLATQRSSVTTVESTYHFARYDLIGASGSFYDLHFTNVPPPPAIQLTDTQTASGSAFWLHRLFGGDWGGISYRFDRITFNPHGETRVHTFSAVDTISLSKRFSLSAFVGPQYSENQGLAQLAPSNAWSVAAGAEGGWQGERTSVSAGYSRSISDGGGVLGGVHLQTVHATFRRQLRPRWVTALAAGHGTNQSVTVPSPTNASSITTTSVGATLEHDVVRNLGIRFGYSHDFQQQFGLPGSAQRLDAHRNRFFVTLSYQWARPLGM